MRKLVLSAAVLALSAAGASAQCGPAGCAVPSSGGVVRQAVGNVLSAPTRLASFAGGQTRGCGVQRTGPVRRLVARIRGR